MNPMNKVVVISLIFLLSAGSLSLAQSVPELAQKALAATVSLEMQDSNGDTLGHGSGFFVRPNLIATNFHVIDGAAKGYARLVNTATTYPIEGFTATDETNDLALLKVSAHGINPLNLGNSDAVQIGETVYVAGNPLGLEGTFSDGIISGRRDSAGKKERLQMTAPISPGSSGGPVLNRKGEVIGVSTSLYNPLFGQNLNFAVPSKALQALLAQSGLPKPLPYRAAASYFTYLLRGYERHLSGDFEGALREFTHAIRLDPDGAGGYFLRGITKAALGKLSAAIVDYDEAIRLDSTDANAYVYRGIAKAALGKLSAAIVDYDEAIRLNPKYALAYYNRGHAKGELRRYPAAITDYDEAIRLDSTDVLAYVNRGIAKAKLGQHYSAIADCNAAIRLDPNDANAYVNRGAVKSRLGRYSAAITDYDEAIRLNPKYAKAYVNRGYVKSRLGRYSAAITDYDEAIRLNPKYAKAYVNRGRAKRNLDQHYSAIDDFDKAIRLEPNDANSYVNRGYDKAQLGQHYSAIIDYDEAIRLDSTDAHAYFGRGLARSKLYNAQAAFRNPAREDFRTALRLATLADNQNLKARIEKELRQLDQ